MNSMTDHSVLGIDGATETVRFIPNKDGDIGILFEALADAQSNYAPVVNNREGTGLDANNNPYSYFYADLEALLTATRPALNAAGLSLIQIPNGSSDTASVLSVLAHKSGARIESHISITRGPMDLELGSKITLVRRWVAFGLTGASSADSMEGPASSAPGESEPELDAGIPTDVSKAMAEAKTIRDLSKAFNKLSIELRQKSMKLFEYHQQRLADRGSNGSDGQ